MSYIGIDPGKSGGLVVLLDNGDIEYTPMPKTRRDVWLWFDGLVFRRDDAGEPGYVAAIEKLQAFPLKAKPPKPGQKPKPPPRQSPKSLMTFGQGYGELLMALTAADISTEEVPPKTWQKAVGMFRQKNEPQPQWKERLRGKAQELFPKLPIWNEPRTKGKQLAIADALLIAWYCRRVNH
jgi:hypothetical protein